MLQNSSGGWRAEICLFISTSGSTSPKLLGPTRNSSQGAAPASCSFSHSEIESGLPLEMTYVIYEPCVGTKDASCAEVCPLDCIHPTPDEPGFEEHEQLYIDLSECINCDARVEASPSRPLCANTTFRI